MKTLLCFFALVLCSATHAAETRLTLRVSGLFQPDRKDDLQRVAGVLTIKNGDDSGNVKLADVDYDNANATFVYEGESKIFKNVKPEDMSNRIDNALRQASNHTFTILPPGIIPHDKQREVKIQVGGMDCKACSFGLYLALYNQAGVDRVTASFKTGWVSAWIDPEKTSQETLEDVLRKRELTVKKQENP